MSIDNRQSTETEVTEIDNLETEYEPNYILEYLKKFGDGVFEVCEDCFESGKLVSLSPNEYNLEMNESGTSLPMRSSYRRRSFW
jgi:hypothetical protein